MRKQTSKSWRTTVPVQTPPGCSALMSEQVLHLDSARKKRGRPGNITWFNGTSVTWIWWLGEKLQTSVCWMKRPTCQPFRENRFHRKTAVVRDLDRPLHVTERIAETRLDGGQGNVLTGTERSLEKPFWGTQGQRSILPGKLLSPEKGFLKFSSRESWKQKGIRSSGCCCLYMFNFKMLTFVLSLCTFMDLTFSWNHIKWLIYLIF